MKLWKLFKQQIKIFWPFILVCSIYVLISLLWIDEYTNCLFKMVTGFPCPGCGLTRAFLSILHFDFKASFFYNPSWPVVILIVLVIFFSPTKLGKTLMHSKIFWAFSIGIIFGLYIYRMINIFPNYPLNYEPRNLINILKKLLY